MQWNEKKLATNSERPTPNNFSSIRWSFVSPELALSYTEIPLVVLAMDSPCAIDPVRQRKRGGGLHGDCKEHILGVRELVRGRGLEQYKMFVLSHRH